MDLQLTGVHYLVLGVIALVVLLGVIYLLADNRAHKKRMYEASLRNKNKTRSHEPSREEVG